jgi:hypothetical protein
MNAAGAGSLVADRAIRIEQGFAGIRRGLRESRRGAEQRKDGGRETRKISKSRQPGPPI